MICNPMLNKTAIKKLSLLASTFLFSLSAASGAEQITTGTPATLRFDNGLESFSDNDFIKLGGNHNIQTGEEEDSYIIDGINLDGKTSTFEVGNGKFLDNTQTVNLGSVVTPGANGGLSLVFYNANVQITGESSDLQNIAVNDYSGLKLVDFNNQDKVLRINATGINFTNNYKSTGGDNGSIFIMKSDTIFSGSFDSNIGSRVKNLEISLDTGATTLNTNLNLSGNLTVNQDSVLTVNAGKTINAQNIYFGVITDAGFTNAPKIIFQDDTTVNAPILYDGFAFSGDLEFQGGTSINGNIGTSKGTRVSNVDFTSNDPNHRSSLNNPIYADNITAMASTLGIDAEEVELCGSESASYQSTTFDLGENVALFTGNTVNFKGAPVFNTTFTGDAGGHLAAEGIEINMSKVDSIVINLTDNSPVPGPEGRKFTVFAELRDIIIFDEGGPAGATPGTIQLTGNENVTLNVADRPLVEWTHDKGILCQKMVDNPQQVVMNNVTDTVNAEVILASPAASDLLNAVNNGSGNEVLDRLQPVIALGAEAAAAALETAFQMVSGDVKTQTGRIGARLQNIQSVGVASGDDIESHGAWIAPIYGMAKQGKRNSNPGYVSKYYGGMVGFDTLIDEDTTIGISASYMHHIITHKDENLGDKTNMDTASLLLYGYRNLSDHLFVQGVASVGSNSLDNKEIRQTFPNPSIACARYRAHSFTGEIIAGYTHKMSESSTITPLLGFEFTSLGKVQYDESGAGNQNLSVTRKLYNRGEVILGAKYNKSIEYSDFTFIPEIHGFVRHDLLKEKFKSDIRFRNDRSVALIPRTAVQNHTTFLIGGGGDIRKDNFEYGFSYDYRFAKKYAAHQGVLTLRVQF